MTLCVFLFGALLGKAIYPNMDLFYISYYKIFFFSTILSSFIYSFLLRKKNQDIFFILFINWIISLLIWNFDNFIIIQSLLDTISAVLMFYLGRLESKIICFLFSIMSIVGYLAYCGVITVNHNVFFGVNYPDLLAIMGHIASIVLGISCGDMGIFKRLRSLFPLAANSFNRFFSNFKMFKSNY